MKDVSLLGLAIAIAVVAIPPVRGIVTQLILGYTAYTIVKKLEKHGTPKPT